MDALLNQVKLVKNFKYQEFVKLFEQCVKQYNSTPHSSLIHKDAQGRITKLTPDEVFASDKRSLRIAPHDLIEHAFRVSTIRKISKDGLISFKGASLQNTSPIWSDWSKSSYSFNFRQQN